MNENTSALAVAGQPTEIERVRFDREAIDVLKNTIAKGTSDVELRLFVATCERMDLDPFRREIHCVMRKEKDPKTGAYNERMTIQIGVDGYRKFAESHP